MAIRLLLISFVFFQTQFSNAQMHWEWVPGAPTFTPVDTDRTTDITFVDDTVGYLITNTAKVYRTQNGGDNWYEVTQLRYVRFPEYSYNEIEFFTRDTGYAIINQDSVLYKTTDGGISWSQIKLANQNPRPVVYRISKFGNMLYCYYSRNGYALLYKIHANSSSSQIDTIRGVTQVYGFQATTESNLVLTGDSSWRGRIALSTDKGQTWSNTFTLPKNYFVYELHMTDSTIGHALCSRYANGNHYFFVKTTDGGRNWSGIPGTDTLTSGLGANIFFMNENIGWTGHYPTGMLETTDGGATWHFLYEGQKIYCFTKKPSGIIYAAGKNVIRIDSRLINSLEQIPPQKKDDKKFVVYPNPASNYFSVSQSGSNSTQPVLIKLFDVLGHKLLEQKTYLNERISVSGLASGVYKIQISTAEASEFHTLIVTQHN